MFGVLPAEKGLLAAPWQCPAKAGGSRLLTNAVSSACILCQAADCQQLCHAIVNGFLIT